MNRRGKSLFLTLFLVLVIDLLFFTALDTYPTFFSELLTSFGPEALGLAIIGGFITAIVVSTGLLFLTYGEIKAIIGKPLRVETVYPEMEKAGLVHKIKEFVEKNVRNRVES